MITAQHRPPRSRGWIGHQFAVGWIRGNIEKMGERASRSAKCRMRRHVLHQLAVEVDAPPVAADGIEELRARAHRRRLGSFPDGFRYGHVRLSDRGTNTEVYPASKWMRGGRPELNTKSSAPPITVAGVSSAIK